MEIDLSDELRSDGKPFQCDSCPKSFIRASSLEEHILNKHTEDKKFQCTECFETNKKLVKSFATQHILNKHIKRVHGPPRFKCQVCVKTFQNSSNFALHKRTHSQTDRKGHKCDICSKEYRFNYELQIHLFNVHKQRRENVVYFKCEICSREFLHRSQLEQHIVRQHVVDKSFECPVCSKTFIDQLALEKHMKNHDRQMEYFCDVCSKGFKMKKNLMNHLGVEHKHFFYCDKKCFTSFKNKLYFDAHISDSNQELKCYICQETLNSECNLKIHTDSHVKEIKTKQNEIKTENQIKPLDLDATELIKLESIKELNLDRFQCELCFKGFDREAYLTAHRNQVHPYAEWKCDFKECSKSFKWYSRLKRHKMMHSETKEFVCNICQKSFYRTAPTA